MNRSPTVYILASKRNGTLYVGVTSDPIKRLWEHKHGVADGFTKTYKVHALVYLEQHDRMEEAILREKQIKKWNRAWKIRLIEEGNPEWRDLYPDIVEAGLLAASAARPSGHRLRRCSLRHPAYAVPPARE
jgi:putative endonuclease